ncbi:MAG: hypothetical protein JWO36_5599 [Myxococcales bacterium]|nr:hypothetical protein [Myxococcales bacterium]
MNSGLGACGPAAHHAGVDGSIAGDAAADTTVIPTIDAQAASGPVHVVITADNAYCFGCGDVGSITHFTQGLAAAADHRLAAIVQPAVTSRCAEVAALLFAMICWQS